MDAWVLKPASLMNTWVLTPASLMDAWVLTPASLALLCASLQAGFPLSGLAV